MSTTKTKSALVIGCAGKTGSKVAKLLLTAGYEVVGVDNMSTGTYDNIPQAEKFTFVPGDLRDLSLFNMLKAVNLVFNCAGAFDEKQVAKNRVGSQYVNVIGMINVFEYCLRHKAKLIYANDDSIDATLLNAQRYYITELAELYKRDYKLKYVSIWTSHPERLAETMIKQITNRDSSHVED